MPLLHQANIVSLANGLGTLGDDVTMVNLFGRLVSHCEGGHKQGIEHSISTSARLPYYLSRLSQTQVDFFTLFSCDLDEDYYRLIHRAFSARPYLLYLTRALDDGGELYQALKRSGVAADAHALVAESESVAARAGDFFGRPVHMVSAGINPLHYYPSAVDGLRLRGALGIGEATKVLLTIAPLEEREGIQQVIEALPGVLRQFGDIRYFVVGEGSYAAELRSLCARLGLESVVRFVAAAGDLLPYYNMADVFVLMSRNRAIPISCIEAMACARPMLLASNERFVEALPSSCSLHVPPRDAEQLADGILCLLNGAQAQAMGAQARLYALRHYTWTARARQIHQLCSGMRPTRLAAA